MKYLCLKGMKIMNTLSINEIYMMLSNLDKDNKQWLADRLMADVNEGKLSHKEETLLYPKIPKDFEVSDSVRGMVMGHLPEGFDFEAETDKMWEELAK